MNHSKTHTTHVRRVLHIPAVPMNKTDDPIVIRRNYDITASCGRRRDGDDGTVMMQMHLTRTTPLWRCIAVGAAAVGVTAAVIGICRAKRQLLLRRKYAHRYAQQLKLQKLQIQQKCSRQNTAAHASAQKA